MQAVDTAAGWCHSDACEQDAFHDISQAAAVLLHFYLLSTSACVSAATAAAGTVYSLLQAPLQHLFAPHVASIFIGRCNNQHQSFMNKPFFADVAHPPACFCAAPVGTVLTAGP
jgi:hypothetical protein